MRKFMTAAVIAINIGGFAATVNAQETAGRLAGATSTPFKLKASPGSSLSVPFQRAPRTKTGPARSGLKRGAIIGLAVGAAIGVAVNTQYVNEGTDSMAGVVMLAGIGAGVGAAFGAGLGAVCAMICGCGTGAGAGACATCFGDAMCGARLVVGLVTFLGAAAFGADSGPASMAETVTCAVVACGASSSELGCLKEWTSQPCGLTPERTCLMTPSLPDVSIPCRIASAAQCPSA